MRQSRTLLSSDAPVICSCLLHKWRSQRWRQSSPLCCCQLSAITPCCGGLCVHDGGAKCQRLPVLSLPFRPMLPSSRFGLRRAEGQLSTVPCHPVVVSVAGLRSCLPSDGFHLRLSFYRLPWMPRCRRCFVRVWTRSHWATLLRVAHPCQLHRCLGAEFLVPFPVKHGFRPW